VCIPNLEKILWDWVVGPAVRRYTPYHRADYWVVVYTLLNIEHQKLTDFTFKFVGEAVNPATNHGKRRLSRGPLLEQPIVKPQLIHSFKGAFALKKESEAASTRETPEVVNALIDASFKLFVAMSPPSFEDSIELMVTVSQRIVMELPSSHSHHVHAVPSTITTAAWEHLCRKTTACARMLEQAYRVHRNPKKLFGLTCSKLVPALLPAKHALRNCEGAFEVAASTSMASLLYTVLLAPDHVVFYREAVDSDLESLGDDVATSTAASVTPQKSTQKPKKANKAGKKDEVRIRTTVVDMYCYEFFIGDYFEWYELMSAWPWMCTSLGHSLFLALAGPHMGSTYSQSRRLRSQSVRGDWEEM
jgi:hypothetical protein